MSKVLRFNLKAPIDQEPQETHFIKDIWTRFFPNGRYVLNRTEWKGKEPRSCAVTRASSKPKQVGDGHPDYRRWADQWGLVLSEFDRFLI